MAKPIESTSNPFGGVVPIPQELDTDPGVFRLRLAESLSAWKDQGFLAVWLEIPIAKSQLIPVAVEAGFVFHHSDDDYLMLIHRLEPGYLSAALRYSLHWRRRGRPGRKQGVAGRPGEVRFSGTDSFA